MFTSLVWNNLGTILELRKIASYFTPAGMIAVYLGVPVAAVSVTIFIIKKLLNHKRILANYTFRACK